MNRARQEHSRVDRATTSAGEAPALATLLAHPMFSDLDRRFAQFLERLAKKPSPELALAAALVSHVRGEGHICLDLSRANETLVPAGRNAGAESLILPEFGVWRAALQTCGIVGAPGEFKPLVLDGQGRLYLHRYWKYEIDLAQAILHRAAMEPAPVNDSVLGEMLERYFPSTDSDETDWQRVAAFIALTRQFCIISGGPGTGKTRTVVVLLAMLLEHAGRSPLRIALAAPTGKAAARLQESIRKARPALACDETVKARLPEDAATVHRLLGTVPDSAYFKHHAGNPLPFDVIVIDEASMVDLALMAKLFAALPPHARVILLGDKDQLASVEAGAVLGDICHGAGVNSFSEAVRARFRRVTGNELPSMTSSGGKVLNDCIVQLQKHYRFGEDNGILALSRAVNQGNDEEARRWLQEGDGASGGVSWAPLPREGKLKERLRAKVLAGFREVTSAPDARAALRALGRFRVLCAPRRGPFGVENVNRLVEEILGEAGHIRPRERWYAGRPVMVLKNDYNLRLFNGDIGVIRPDAESGQPRVFFPDADNELRAVAPVRLPEHETVFAMTVHKSQGSEFEDVLLILPERENPVLTRELVYTAITRASRRVELWLDPAVFRAALARRVERTSGLRDALWS